MQWETNKNAIKIGVPITIQVDDGQYMAGFFHRQGSEIVFCDSSGAWTIQLKRIQRWVELK